jgi:hypothetical protein
MNGSKKIYYLRKNEQVGPVSVDELIGHDISRDTLIWHYGLDTWTRIDQVEGLESVVNSIPPPLTSIDTSAQKREVTEIESSSPPSLTSIEAKATKREEAETVKSKEGKDSTGTMYTVFIITVFVLSLIAIIIFLLSKNKYDTISLNSYNSDEDFQMYVTKFYRDAEAFGLYPLKPRKTVIKFSRLDQIEGLNHYHGVSFGSEKDDIIEIYINPSTWEKFNKPKRYYLMYHELAHDILNVQDLEDTPENEGKLMYPILENYDRITMDDFIESSHELFEEVAAERWTP